MQSHAEHAVVQSTAAVAPAADSFLPHGFCYLWNKPLLMTHLTSDVLIGISYVVISLALVTLVHRARRDVPFSVIFIAFGLFIVACGMTHFVEVWTLWRPDYWLAGSVKAVTAVASVATAAVMPSTLPKVLSTIRDARLSRERELAAARAAALEEQNELLQTHAVELELQTEEARALAEELEQTNQDLLHAVADAEEARRAAEAANRAKSDFLAVMSHELRTPLNAIGGFTDLLDMGLRGPVTDEQRLDLARIKRSQRHLLGVITDVLNYARLEAGHVEYRPDDVAVTSLVEDVATMLEPQFAAKRLALVTDPCDAPVVARADGEKLRQIVLNLLSNALKFTAAGSDGRAARVTIRCETNGGRALIRVADTGAGIPADQVERIFEPFVQLDPGLTRTTEGAGLGLAISRDLARGMGGDLTVESCVGEGSTFTVALPLAAPSPVR